MTIINRSFVYRGDIKVSKEDLNLARIGKKTCTIRLGKMDVANKYSNLVSGNEKLKVKITDIDKVRIYSELTVQDANAEGFDTLNQLYDDLRKYYGELDPQQPITVINFKTLTNSSTG